MPLPFDATLKELVRSHLADFESALDLRGPPPSGVLNVDLSTISAASDIVVGYGKPPQFLVDLNFQASRDASLADRLLLYNVLLHHRFRVPVHTVVVLLRPAADDPALSGRVHYRGHRPTARLDFRFEVTRVWQRSVARLLTGGLGTLPLAPLGKLPAGESLTEALPGLIERIAGRLNRETESADAARLMTATYVLTGLRLPREQVRTIFQGARAMHESSTYQGILEEGRIDQSHKILLRQGRARLGSPSDAVVKTLKSIDDLDRLDRMLDQILQVRSWKRLLETP